MIFTAGFVLFVGAVFARRLHLDDVIDLSERAQNLATASFLLGWALMVASASMVVFPIIWRVMP